MKTPAITNKQTKKYISIINSFFFLCLFIVTPFFQYISKKSHKFRTTKKFTIFQSGQYTSRFFQCITVEFYFENKQINDSYFVRNKQNREKKNNHKHNWS